MNIYPKENKYTLDEKYIRKGKPIQYIINNKCWECVSHSLNNKGYCRIVINKKEILIHRYSYELYKSKIPDGMVIMHKCDNPKCINPEHLELGTQKDNMQDMINKGRNKTTKGYKHTEQAKKKLSEKSSGENNGFYNKKHTEEVKKKLSEQKKKLSEQNILEIKEMLIKKIKLQIIADKFNVSIANISNIKKGKSVYSKFLGGGLNDWIY